MVGPWWREGASRLPRMPTGGGEGLPCAGAHAAMRAGARTPAFCTPPAVPRQTPMEHPRVPRGAVGWVVPASGPHADAREAVGARGGLGESQ
eukprot:2384497-Prymnesium_polylepis.1